MNPEMDSRVKRTTAGERERDEHDSNRSFSPLFMSLSDGRI